MTQAKCTGQISIQTNGSMKPKHMNSNVYKELIYTVKTGKQQKKIIQKCNI